MKSHTVHSTPTPSRQDNPFATCWTRPGALAFRFVNGESVEQLVNQLAAQGWWGEIVGPHGSGKSTLLETLKPAVTAAGRCVRAITLRDGQRRLPSDFMNWEGQARAEPPSSYDGGSAPPSPSCRKCALVVIDGYEQLGWLERVRLKRRCRRAGAGLLVTSHAPTGLPSLIHLAPELPLIERLVADLCAEVSTGVTSVAVAASHACHGSNVREILFDLYDLHERLRRTARTQPLVDA